MRLGCSDSLAEPPAHQRPACGVKEQHPARFSGMRVARSGSGILVGRRLGMCVQLPEAFGSPGPTLQLWATPVLARFEGLEAQEYNRHCHPCAVVVLLE